MPPHTPGTEFFFGGERPRRGVVVTTANSPGEIVGVFLDWRGTAYVNEFR